MRRKFNKITALRNVDGEWIFDSEALKTKAVKFFQNLYGENPGPLRPLPPNAFPKISSEDVDFLEKGITNEEIKSVLFDMAPLKAPGSDGFQTTFFQNQWDNIGGGICEWVKKVFEEGIIDPKLNNTLIVLIPKVPNLENFSQFRPISLCLVLYKLLMKIIANRFKSIFPKIIGQEQACFIAGMSIVNNAIIAQVGLHSMRVKKQSQWMAIKIDLEKAYDRVRWDFVEASLIAAGIPFFLVKVIRNVISSSSMQVLWNGVPPQKFRLVRGIRQGCPLSPYLFVLCMEWLGHRFHAGISSREWNPIRLSHRGPNLSHLLFADDLVIFSRAVLTYCGLLKTFLSNFCELSGYKVNARKTNVFFSSRVQESLKGEINVMLGF
ncbi:hypothetical protein J1N35_041282 [Gossypium stocksii]|uniref:Reverse transcriptase domain-containing protein n=1 Tax=Gossypium stocksii TaxID=47602 RepID=A0A9D3ZJK1_9ROSI|nr:hypothetical protein J1N35_041282 [Gossypium stocksii]